VDIESLTARRTELGSLSILRALPRRQRRTVGPWCFLDRYGPIQFSGEKPMDVAPHPHIGLQTVSWLVSGEIVHNDSLGFEALMRAGQLNLMTSGRGIAHSEETPPRNSGEIDGVQLWVALPDAARDAAPMFDHYASLPQFEISPATVTLIAGAILGHQSPARTFHPMVGAEVAFHEEAEIDLPLEPAFEHAMFVLRGDTSLNAQPVRSDALHYLSPHRDEIRIRATGGSRLLLIGGEPFTEPIVMWWNFVARTRDEIAQARQDWIEHRRFGDVTNYDGPRLPAPDLASAAPANPAS
jgi:redox-sensitive bicupin YhaK (pirin superfamily)